MFQKRNPQNASEGMQKMQNLINENFRYIPRWNSSGNSGYQKPTTFVKQDVVTNLGFLKQTAAQKSNFALNDLEPLTLIDTLDYYESRANKAKKSRKRRKPVKQHELKETKSSTAFDKTKLGKTGRPKGIPAMKTIRKSVLPKSKNEESELNKLRKELPFASSEGSLQSSKAFRERDVPTWKTIKKFQKNLELKGFNVILESRTKKQNPTINNNPAWQLLKERMKYM